MILLTLTNGVDPIADSTLFSMPSRRVITESDMLKSYLLVIQFKNLNNNNNLVTPLLLPFYTLRKL